MRSWPIQRYLSSIVQQIIYNKLWQATERLDIQINQTQLLFLYILRFLSQQTNSIGTQTIMTLSLYVTSNILLLLIPAFLTAEHFCKISVGKYLYKFLYHYVYQIVFLFQQMSWEMFPRTSKDICNSSMPPRCLRQRWFKGNRQNIFCNVKYHFRIYEKQRTSLGERSRRFSHNP